MNRTEALQRHLLVYNSGKMCKKKHDPTLRITTTGRCLECEKAYHKSQHKSQQSREKYVKPGVIRSMYTFIFPDGERIIVGPYCTPETAHKAFERRFKVFYGVDFNWRFLPPVTTPEDKIYKWQNSNIKK